MGLILKTKIIKFSAIQLQYKLVNIMDKNRSFLVLKMIFWLNQLVWLLYAFETCSRPGPKIGKGGPWVGKMMVKWLFHNLKQILPNGMLMTISALKNDLFSDSYS